LNNFGLINRTYPDVPHANDKTQWQSFAKQVKALNAKAPRNTVYKVLFMGRHGQGYHNVAESSYGTPAWNCYWAQLTGNGTIYWEDAHLTRTGELQAQIASTFWKHEIEVEKMTPPQSYYTSPMARCLATANITFGGLDLQYPFIPTVKELLREGISIHTCDHRSNKTWIRETYPEFKIEKHFNEYDGLWNGVTAEEESAHQKRMLTFLDDVFTHDHNTWISFTSHSGTIRTILEVIGHQSFNLATGSVIPVLVEAKFISDTPTTSVGGYTTSTWCHNGPPATSLSDTDQGCVCQSTTAPLPILNTQAPLLPNQTEPINEYTTTTIVVQSTQVSHKDQPCASTTSVRNSGY
jgi:broad specificity phosphatase PhoE